MREMKFRAWDKKEKKMKDDFCIDAFGVKQRLHVSEEYSEAINKVHKNEPLARGDWAVLDYTDWYAIENYIVMQYTGLKDKNGKEICEGDIVWKNHPHIIRFGETGMIETVGFYLKEIHNHEIHVLFAYTIPFEIIGNIYENPELLKEKS